jgi:opacity protein-like surface antigen
MPQSFRSVLLLGSAVALLNFGVAAAGEDPLLPEGATAPAKGRELVLPPIINEAPPGAPIILPPPGQESQMGVGSGSSHGSAGGGKVDARVADDGGLVVPDTFDLPPVQQAETGEPPKKRARKSPAIAAPDTQVGVAAAGPVAEPAAPPPVQAKVQPEAPVVPAAKAVARLGEPKSGAAPKLELKPETQVADATGVVKEPFTLSDAPPPGVGGPELKAPPKPEDGMSVAAAPAIRDGATLTARQETLLAPQPKPAEAQTAQPAAPKAPNAPAIERFQIAQATAAPRPVTPKEMGRASDGDDWSHVLAAGAGYGVVWGEAQGFLGTTANPGAGAPLSIANVSTDDDAEVASYRFAVGANLKGLMDPLGGGDATPFLSLLVEGYRATQKSSHSFAAPAGQSILVQAVDGSAANAIFDGGSLDAVYRGKKDQTRVEAAFGQVWDHGGVLVSAQMGLGVTQRDWRHRFSFETDGALRGGGEGGEGGGEGGEGGGETGGYMTFALTGPATHSGSYDADLDADTYSVFVGAGVRAPLTADKKLKADANVRASLDFNRVRGTDRRLIVSSGGATVASDATRLSKTEESVGYGAGVGLSYDVHDNVTLRLGADYRSAEAAPVIVRDGVNASQIRLEREEELIGSLTATLKF